MTLATKQKYYYNQIYDTKKHYYNQIYDNSVTIHTDKVYRHSIVHKKLSSKVLYSKLARDDYKYLCLQGKAVNLHQITNGNNFEQ